MNMHSRIALAPTEPGTLEQTGLSAIFAREIFLKTVFRKNLELASDMARELCVTVPIVMELVEMCREQKLIETLGNRTGSLTSQMRYQMTETGRERALQALKQSEYFGPLPVPMAGFSAQVERQTIRNVGITKDKLEAAMSHLIIPDGLLDKIGPAVNSGKSILMYGPPGNGKSSISNGIRAAMGDQIFMPRVLEYAGQVISVYDPVIHTSAQDVDDDTNSLRRIGGNYDKRYVQCDRPSVITGGELSLDMLELKYNSTSKTYQAPLQLKAAGGVFIVDDLGRQAESPQALINRWIVPMEGGEDILSLQSGEKFTVPFDTLVIFSTNFHPNKIFDGAALRRIFFKILIDAPNREEMLQIFLLVAKVKRFALDKEALTYLFETKYGEVDHKYAAYQAPFVIDQMNAICEYQGLPRTMSVDLIDQAWGNMFVEDRDIDG
ncbi:MAG: ATPase [Rhodobacterales bacterium]